MLSCGGVFCAELDRHHAMCLLLMSLTQDADELRMRCNADVPVLVGAGIYMHACGADYICRFAWNIPAARGIVAVATEVVWTMTFSSIVKPFMQSKHCSTLNTPKPRIADCKLPMVTQPV